MTDFKHHKIFLWPKMKKVFNPKLVLLLKKNWIGKIELFRTPENFFRSKTLILRKLDTLIEKNDGWPSELATWHVECFSMGICNVIIIKVSLIVYKHKRINLVFQRLYHNCIDFYHETFKIVKCVIYVFQLLHFKVSFTMNTFSHNYMIKTFIIT